MNQKLKNKKTLDHDGVPLISVIIPVYNGENFLSQALKSIQNQSFRNFECVVVDDGSNDEHFVYGEIQKMKDERFRFLKKVNGGTASAMNLGITNSTGRFICWLSHDDLYPAKKLEHHILNLGKQQSNVIQFGDWKHIDKKGNFLHESVCGPELKKIVSNIGPLERLLLNANTCLFPREVFERIGLFDESLKYTQDYDFFLRAVLDGVQFKHVNQVLAYQRLHEGQATQSLSVQEENNRIVRRILQSVQSDLKSHLFKRRKLDLYLKFLESQGYPLNKI